MPALRLLTAADICPRSVATGDFAVLLQSGMSVRQALFYNIVSSVLCLMGMILGMVLGNMTAFSSWVFAAAAGSFLYIALVDMVRET